jgi:hypothetical protein
MAWDLLIRNGTLVDGTGAPRRRADIAIAGGSIREIGEVKGSAGKTIEPKAWSSRRASSTRTRITTRRSAGTAASRRRRGMA